MNLLLMKKVNLNVNPEILSEYFAGLGKSIASKCSEVDFSPKKENNNDFVMCPV